MFVGRDRELDRIRNILSGKDPAKFVYIYGPSGIGKSFLLHESDRLCTSSEWLYPGLIDLSRTEYRDSIHLLTKISAQLGVGYFEAFNSLVREYLILNSEKRTYLIQELRESFFQEYKSLSLKKKTVLLFDTLDLVRNTEIERMLLPSLVEATGNKSLVIIAGREEPTPSKPLFQINYRIDIKLSGFSLKETKILAKSRFEDQGLSALTEKSIQSIHKFSTRKPLLIGLALDAIFETGKEEHILQVAGEEFEKRIIVWIHNLEDTEQRTLFEAAILDQRFNEDVMANLNNMKPSRCLEVLDKLRRFSFVRITEPNFSLHDEMLFLIEKYLGFPKGLRRKLYSEVIIYYKNVLEPTVTSRDGKYVRLERIHYQLLLDSEKGFKDWEEVFEDEIKLYDLDYCHALLTEIGKHRPNLTTVEQYKADLLEGELSIAEYRPLEARPKFEYLIAMVSPVKEPQIALRAVKGLGECAINECTVDVEALSENIDHWKEAIRYSQVLYQEVGNEFVGSLLMDLGFAYQLLGMHGKAEDTYLQANNIYQSNKLESRQAEVLDKLGSLYREQYESKKAFDYLKQSLQIKENIGDDRGKGVTYNLLALVLGDQWKIKEAEEHFSKALQLLEGVNDPRSLASVYGGYAWFKFITRNEYPDNLKEAEKYVKKGIAIAEERSFGRGLSKDYHTLYHIIELKHDLKTAKPFIQKAYHWARRSSDIFFLFDCLAHIAKIDYQMGAYSKIPEYISEIELYERRGAKISVFKGRIFVILGYIDLMSNKNRDAIRYFDKGWRIIIDRRTASTVPPLNKELEEFKNEIISHSSPKENKAYVCKKLIKLWRDEEGDYWDELVSSCMNLLNELK